MSSMCQAVARCVDIPFPHNHHGGAQCARVWSDVRTSHSHTIIMGEINVPGCGQMCGHPIPTPSSWGRSMCQGVARCADIPFPHHHVGVIRHKLRPPRGLPSDVKKGFGLGNLS